MKQLFTFCFSLLLVAFTFNSINANCAFDNGHSVEIKVTINGKVHYVPMYSSNQTCNAGYGHLTIKGSQNQYRYFNGTALSMGGNNSMGYGEIVIIGKTSNYGEIVIIGKMISQTLELTYVSGGCVYTGML